MPQPNTVLERVSEYARTEPSFTTAFAAWELGISASAVAGAVIALLRHDHIRQIEAQSGPYAAVYEWVEATPATPEAKAERESAMQRTVRDALATEPKSLSKIVAELQLPKPRVRTLLDGLVTAGTVTKVGQTRGTKYMLTPPAQEASRAQLHVVTGGTSAKELDDREVAYVTQAGPRALAG